DPRPDSATTAPRLAVYPEENTSADGWPVKAASSDSSAWWSAVVPVTRRDPPEPAPQLRVASIAPCTTSGWVLSPRQSLEARSITPSLAARGRRERSRWRALRARAAASSQSSAGERSCWTNAGVGEGSGMRGDSGLGRGGPAAPGILGSPGEGCGADH